MHALESGDAAGHREHVLPPHPWTTGLGSARGLPKSEEAAAEGAGRVAFIVLGRSRDIWKGEMFSS